MEGSKCSNCFHNPRPKGLFLVTQKTKAGTKIRMRPFLMLNHPLSCSSTWENGAQVSKCSNLLGHSTAADYLNTSMA